MEDAIYVIREMKMMHCAKGPERCEKCRDMAKNSNFSLIKLLPGHSMVARPVLEVEINGEKQYFEYDIVQIFDNKGAAEEYSKEHHIPIIIPER